MVTTPVGKLKLMASETGLVGILWEKDDSNRAGAKSALHDKNNPILAETERQLCEYFAGKRQSFALPIVFIGTDFQKRVWNALLTIPYGHTKTYKEIAKQIGNERALRAVGAASSKNPISIIAPCHRVIGTSGKLTGFAGGLEKKAILLNLERGK